MSAIPPDVLRSALLDPWVKKQKHFSYLEGRRVRTEDVHRAVVERLPDRTFTPGDLDAALRAAGGHGIGPGRLARRLSRSPRWPKTYWFSATAWSTATRRDGGRSA